MSEDPRALWIRSKVCQSLGVTAEEFDQLGSADGSQPGVDEVVAVLNASKPGNLVFYRQSILEEVETSGGCFRRAGPTDPSQSPACRGAALVPLPNVLRW